MYTSAQTRPLPVPTRIRATRILTVCNQKGGVGKTFASVQLTAVAYQASVEPDPIMARVAEQLGDPLSPVTLVSIDPQASAHWWERRARKNHGGFPFEFIQMRDPRDLRHLRDGERQLVVVDTAGNLENEASVRLALEETDDVVVPITTDSLSYDPTARTIEKVIMPLGLPYRVFVNNWEPRDGNSDLIQTQDYMSRRGWRVCKTVVRHYKIHARASSEGMVVTQYPTKKASELCARQDILALGLELGLGPAATLARPALTHATLEVRPS